MSKHSPGPWDHVWDKHRNSGYVFGADGPVIAEVEPTESGEGNARLIAAAPELLAALKSTMKTLAMNYLDHVADDDDQIGFLALIERIEGSE